MISCGNLRECPRPPSVKWPLCTIGVKFLGRLLFPYRVKVTERSVEEFSEDVEEWQFKNDRLRERVSCLALGALAH